MGKGFGSIIILVVIALAVVAIVSVLGVAENKFNGINQVEAPAVIQPMNPIIVQDNGDGTTSITVSKPIADVNDTSSKANERNLEAYASVLEAEGGKIGEQGEADEGRLFGGFFWLIGIVCLIAVLRMGGSNQ